MPISPRSRRKPTRFSMLGLHANSAAPPSTLGLSGLDPAADLIALRFDAPIVDLVYTLELHTRVPDAEEV